jgi:PTH1 family peptidyl-tRNA hydrolase
MWFKLEKTGGAAGWLIACLGNPGIKYEKTRHNVGFMTADVIAARNNIKINKLKYKALFGTVQFGGEKAVIIKPQTYMNMSGQAVYEAASYHKIPMEHVLVVFDDASLPAGKLRIRKEGSSGGHNGIKSIISCCGTEGFPRIKIGVGAPPHPDYDMADWVLGTFPEQDKAKMSDSVRKAAEAVEELIINGVDATMNKYNGQ